VDHALNERQLFPQFLLCRSRAGDDAVGQEQSFAIASEILLDHLVGDGQEQR
jgi:hypothetical protein